MLLRLKHFFTNDARRREGPLGWRLGQALLKSMGKPPADDQIIYNRLLIGKRRQCHICHGEYWSKRGQPVCGNLDCWRVYYK